MLKKFNISQKVFVNVPGDHLKDGVITDCITRDYGVVYEVRLIGSDTKMIVNESHISVPDDGAGINDVATLQAIIIKQYFNSKYSEFPIRELTSEQQIVMNLLIASVNMKNIDNSDDC